ncbi:MAG TPA: hypothetical protein VJM53_04950 [Burkholderiales bacterium]|jgi:hypothetical protein|nr:hypothetical protein [Burkholderiales bacterium]
MKTRILALMFAGLFLNACSEESQVSMYEQGEYSGKADAQPWDGGAYGGDKQKWDRALRERAQHQNEYVRTQ